MQHRDRCATCGKVKANCALVRVSQDVWKIGGRLVSMCRPCRDANDEMKRRAALLKEDA
jgi:hypothetical protein